MNVTVSIDGEELNRMVREAVDERLGDVHTDIDSIIEKCWRHGGSSIGMAMSSVDEDAYEVNAPVEVLSISPARHTVEFRPMKSMARREVARDRIMAVWWINKPEEG